MKISRLILVFFYYIMILVNISEQQQLPNSTTISICHFTASNSQRTPCSSNRDCDCFSLTISPSVGICALAVLPSTDIVRCNMDNRTCPIENAVYINDTRCGQPGCYALASAHKLVCPRNTTSTTTTTVRTTLTSRTGGFTNTTQSTTTTICGFQWLNETKPKRDTETINMPQYHRLNNILTDVELDDINHNSVVLDWLNRNENLERLNQYSNGDNESLHSNYNATEETITIPAKQQQTV
ncbi:unnamed protein product [Adineta steineri]|uniref:Uncharacterized protein n=1 Tax=Adineta steineri TaxID=433720 RepID=A0A814DCT9_9BILA|nr:unnamed protein product [Adineta steineri]CAF3610623.1 unnamed protein product [Adineta steineri]